MRQEAYPPRKRNSITNSVTNHHVGRPLSPDPRPSEPWFDQKNSRSVEGKDTVVGRGQATPEEPLYIFADVNSVGAEGLPEGAGR